MAIRINPPDTAPQVSGNDIVVEYHSTAALPDAVDIPERTSGPSIAAGSDPVDEDPPLDLFGDIAVVGEPVLAPDMLPEVIADFAVDVAERLGVSLETVALPALVCTASAIHDSWRIQPAVHNTEWTESARLWGAIIGDPSTLKSPSISAAIKPLKAVEESWRSQTAEDCKNYDREMIIHRKALMKAKSTADMPEEPEKVTVRRTYVEDTTVEKLSEILADNPGGVLSICDELSRWFGGFDAYRASGVSRDQADWLELYNGGSRAIDRIARGTVHVPNWSACVIGGIQPAMIARIASKLGHDGILQRFMWVHGRKVSNGIDRVPDAAALTGFRTMIDQLLTSLGANVDGIVIKLSGDAQTERGKIQEVVDAVSVLPDMSPGLLSHLGKWSGLFARLLLTFHVAECASSGRRPDEPVPGMVAQRVRRFMLHFLLPNAIRFFHSTLGGADHIAHSRWLAGYILARGSTKLTKREIGRAYRDLRQDYQAILRAMAVLDLAAWVTPEDRGNGKPPERWIVNPRVHELYGERARIEAERRAEIKASIRRSRGVLATLRQAA